MSLHRYAKKRDANESDIIKVLCHSGITVYALDTPLDLLCGYGGITMIAEVKDPERVNMKRVKDMQAEWERGYTEAQVKFLREWTGGHYLLVTIEDAKAMAANMKAISRHMQAFIKSHSERNDAIEESGNER